MITKMKTLDIIRSVFNSGFNSQFNDLSDVNDHIYGNNTLKQMTHLHM